MSDDVKRYWSPCQPDMTPSDVGGWVRGEDYDRLRAELEELRRWRKDTNLDLDRARKLVNKATERLAEKDKRIARAMNLLDRALGDTDPDIEPDEHEDPVYWAMRTLTGVSDE